MKEDPIKLCCVIPSLQTGGMERVMSILINGFIHYYHTEIHVILYGSKREIYYNINEDAIIHIPTWEFNKKKRLWSSIRTMWFVRKTINTIKPVSVLSFGSRWNSFVLLSCIGVGLPMFISDRGAPSVSIPRFHLLLKRFLYPCSKGIIVQTSFAEKLAKERYRQNNICVIGNPIREIVIPETNLRDNTIVSVGRIVDTKNFDRLIKIFEEIGNKSWKLIIIGGDADGQHLFKKLQEQRDNSQMKDNIILAGTQKDVESYLLKAKIFAFTSSEEGFPNAIGEAMSAGLPVVSYNCITGPSEMIEDGKNGYLIDVFDDATFTKKLQQLMNDDKLRSAMGQYAQKSIKRFSEERIVGQFYEFITNSKQQ